MIEGIKKLKLVLMLVLVKETISEGEPRDLNKGWVLPYRKRREGLNL